MPWHHCCYVYGDNNVVWLTLLTVAIYNDIHDWQMKWTHGLMQLRPLTFGPIKNNNILYFIYFISMVIAREIVSFNGKYDRRVYIYFPRNNAIVLVRCIYMLLCTGIAYLCTECGYASQQSYQEWWLIHMCVLIVYYLPVHCCAPSCYNHRSAGRPAS